MSRRYKVKAIPAGTTVDEVVERLLRTWLEGQLPAAIIENQYAEARKLVRALHPAVDEWLLKEYEYMGLYAGSYTGNQLHQIGNFIASGLRRYYTSTKDHPNALEPSQVRALRL